MSLPDSSLWCFFLGYIIFSKWALKYEKYMWGLVRILPKNGWFHTSPRSPTPICCCVTPTHLQSRRGIEEMLWHWPTCRVRNRAERRQWPTPMNPYEPTSEGETKGFWTLPSLGNSLWICSFSADRSSISTMFYQSSMKLLGCREKLQDTGCVRMDHSGHEIIQQSSCSILSGNQIWTKIHFQEINNDVYSIALQSIAQVGCPSGIMNQDPKPKLDPVTERISGKWRPWRWWDSF